MTRKEREEKYAAKLAALRRKHKPTGDCRTCGLYRGRSNPYPGVAIPGGFGKCLAEGGPCESFTPSLGIGGGLPPGSTVKITGGKVILTGADGQARQLNHVKDAVTLWDEGV